MGVPPMLGVPKRDVSRLGTPGGAVSAPRLSISAGETPAGRMGKMPMTRLSAPASPAFTLVELILVLALIAVVLTIATPSLSGFAASRQTGDAARRLSALGRLASSRAAAQGRACRMVIDADQRTVSLVDAPSNNGQPAPGPASGTSLFSI